MHDSIGVKGCLARKGVVNDDICSICQEEVELVLYALRDCPQVRAIWLQLGVRDMNQSFWRSDLQEWLAMNGKMGNRAMYRRN